MARTWLRAALALSSAALALSSARAAAGPFDLHGTQPHDLDATNPPQSTADKCAACHAGGRDDDGNMVRPTDTWEGTMMAQAARDPLFLAALTVAEQDTAGVGTFCIRCHSPQGYVKGNATPGFGTALDDDDKQGVACEACHRSLDPSATQPVIDPNGPYAGGGQLFWDTGPAKRGPYTNADSPAHTTIQDAFTSSSKLCGQCHELSNPAVHQLDANGHDTGAPFPLDTTYSEWASSDYAKAGAAQKSCIDCHMTKAKGSLTLSTFASAQNRDNPRTHFFAAANTWGIDAVQAAEPTLANARKLQFQAARAAAVTLLGQAVEVAITSAPTAITAGAPIAISVRVTNKSGHKFPTGYADGRRAFLRIELVDDSSGKAVATIGAYDDATQTLALDPQLHVYEAKHEARALDGGAPVEWHISRSNTVAKDTRIPPTGFTPSAATAIVGADYGDGAGGTRDYDEAHVTIAWPSGFAPPASASLTLRASVLFQSTERAFIDELVAANHTDDRGTKLQTVWNSTGKAAPMSIASAEAKVALTAADAGASPGGDGGVPADGGVSVDAGAAPSGSSSGCSCREGSRSEPASGASLRTLFAIGLFVVRRRTRREPAAMQRI